MPLAATPETPSSATLASLARTSGLTEEKMALIELVEKQADGDLVREMLAFAAERIMEVEVEVRTGAAKGLRSPMREVQRNGYREIAPMPRTTHRSRNAEVDFKGEKRSNATHASTTDPEARLYKKAPGASAVLCFMGHALMENRNGLIVQGDLTQADGHAERKAALDMLHRHSPGSTRKLTVGADKAYDAAGFVADLRGACVTPHVAQKARHSAIDGRTTRHKGYALSIKHRKRIEEPFGWAKTIGGMAQTVYRGVERVRSRFILTMAASNLARLPRLLGA